MLIRPGARTRAPARGYRGGVQLPTDPALAAAVSKAHAELLHLDPLGGLLRGEGEARLPPGDPDFDAEVRARLAALVAELERYQSAAGTTAAADPVAADDRLDREALLAGLRRAQPTEGPRLAVGAITLERYLLALLRRLDVQPEPRAAELAGVVEAAPAFLAAAREDVLGGPAAAGTIALAAGRRMPVLLDLAAAAARSLPITTATRNRLEAALGELLGACAEDAGWVLKEYMPAAAVAPPAGEDHRAAGLGMDLAEVEAAAEEMLAGQVAAAGEAAAGDTAAGAAAAETGTTGPVAPAPGRGGHRGSLHDVAGFCRDAQAAVEPWCPEPNGVDFEVAATPTWLRPLVPALALSDPGVLSGAPVRLLVGDLGGQSPEALRAMVAGIHAADYLPASWQRGARVARLLLPAPDAGEGWRALVIEGAPAPAALSPVARRRELSWRAVLALVAAALVRGRMDAAAAASVVAAESGMDLETAALQVAHVALRPFAAMSFIAGRRALAAAVERLGGDGGARARVLAAGPVPALGLDLLQPG